MTYLIANILVIAFFICFMRALWNMWYTFDNFDKRKDDID